MELHANLVKRLSVGNVVTEPLETQVELGLNHIGTAEFDLPTERCPAVRPKETCRLYVGPSDKFTVLLFQGHVTGLESPRPGITKIRARQRSEALDRTHSISMPNSTAREVLQEVVEASGVPFAIPDTAHPDHAYLTTPVPHYRSVGPMRETLTNLGSVHGVGDAVWYEQPDRRVFWGSWGRTAMALNPLPLADNVIQERDHAARVIQIPAVPALRPGMLIEAPGVAFRIEKLRLKDDRMLLEWKPGIV